MSISGFGMDKASCRSEQENEFYNSEFNNQIVHKPAGSLTGRLCEEALRGDVDESTIYNAIQDFLNEYPFAKVFVYTNKMGDARTLYRTEDGEFAFEREMNEDGEITDEDSPEELPKETVSGEELLGHFKTMQKRFKKGGYMMYQRKKIF
jgi:hypothetical protein